MTKPELKKALMDAADWQQTLTVRQCTKISVQEAKEEKITEILNRIWKTTEL